DLGAAIGDDLVHVHVELGPAPGHPDVEGKHVPVLAGEDLVADLDDQPVSLGAETAAGEIGVGCGLLEDRERVDELPGDEVLSDAEVLERALGLGAPQLVCGNADLSQAVAFRTCRGHGFDELRFDAGCAAAWSRGRARVGWLPSPGIRAHRSPGL